MTLHTDYFYGNQVSAYGREHGYLDYATLAKAFDCILNNDIMFKTNEDGCSWQIESGDECYYMDSDYNEYSYEDAQEKIEEIEDRLSEIDDEMCELIDEDKEDSAEYEKLKEEKAALEENRDALEEEHYHEFYQYYIVSDRGAEILSECSETVWYNENLDMYVWGVTHWGTSWDYVLTDIRINVPYGEEE